MELIFNKLSEIEVTAQKIMESAVRDKTALSEELEQQCKDFDTALEHETKEKLSEIRRQLEEDKEQQLNALRVDTENHIASMTTFYKENHDHLCQTLYQKILDQ